MNHDPALVKMSDCIIGGVEGGGTKTLVVLMNIEGEVLAEVIGPSSNPWAVGFEPCCHLIHKLTTEAKIKAGLPKDSNLRCIGLCLSGLEVDSVSKQIENAMREHYPGFSDDYFIGSDTTAPMAMVSAEGGVVLISGTGSNCLLMNPDGSSIQCGGLGYKLGDEGSAYGIAYRCIKICIDSVSKFQKAPNGYSVTTLWESLKKHFKVQTVNDFIPVFHSNFQKDEIASFCVKITKLAEDGDELSKWLFEKAGKDLAKFIQAVYNSADNTLTSNRNGLKVVCVGSVWNSWHLLKTGFEAQLKDTSEANVQKLSLLRLTKSGAIGACYLAAQKANVKNFPYSYASNYRVFYEYVK